MSLKARIRSVLTLGRGITRGLPDPGRERDPFELFDEWMREARESGIALPEAMSVSTATKDGVPSARMMLLKAHGPRGFVFYTNYGSRKCAELDANPHAALLLHWAVLQRQIRIEGTVERTTAEESADYFRTRPRGVRVGAWASRQSAEIPNRRELEDRVREFQQRFKGEDVPTPNFWGGYRLTPWCIEFWQGRVDRLHDRLRYERDGDDWKVVRLYP
jgi:pyridoxamine 5'-phosphate oxidase